MDVSNLRTNLIRSLQTPQADAGGVAWPWLYGEWGESQRRIPAFCTMRTLSLETDPDEAFGRLPEGAVITSVAECPRVGASGTVAISLGNGCFTSANRRHGVLDAYDIGIIRRWHREKVSFSGNTVVIRQLDLVQFVRQ